MWDMPSIVIFWSSTIAIRQCRQSLQGIRVNAVRPGLIDTDMQAVSGEPDRVGRLLATVPMGRVGRPDEVAEAAIFLLSDAASYITGAILPVSGGR